MKILHVNGVIIEKGDHEELEVVQNSLKPFLRDNSAIVFATNDVYALSSLDVRVLNAYYKCLHSFKHDFDKLSILLGEFTEYVKELKLKT